jgi:DNA-directed RNA polymerase specialized sigma24 family protein
MAQKSAPATADPTRAAFEAEALPHLDRLFRLAMWFERNRSEAEDLVQETMMQALQSFHRFQPGTKLSGLAGHDSPERAEQSSPGARSVTAR